MLPPPSSTNPDNTAAPSPAAPPATRYYEMEPPAHPSLSGNTIDWSRTRYADAYARQLELVSRRIRNEITDTLILTEHHPVFTIGRRKDARQHLVWDSSQLQQQGVEVEETNRGGDITYHGPGQIVGYPIMDLRENRDLHRYLRHMEEALIRTLAHYGLFAGRREGMTGIWLGHRKIAAIGIAVKQWVTYHGFALNVAPTLHHFSGIVPCGIVDGTVTSMHAELGYMPDLPTVKHLLTVEFWGIFANSGNPC